MLSLPSLLKTWFDQHPTISLRDLATEAKMTATDLSRIRSEQKEITLEALAKLLPAVERLSNRSEARALLVAYLQDETPLDYAADIQIRAIADAEGTEDKDLITQASERWEKKARKDAEFARMWLTMDGYMHEENAEAVDQHVNDAVDGSTESGTGPTPDEIASDIGAFSTTHQTSQGPVKILSGFTPPPSLAADSPPAEDAALKEMEAAIQRAKDQLADAGKNLTEKQDDSQLAS